MIPMVLGSMGMKRIVVGGQPLWLPSGAGRQHLGSAAVSLLFMFSATAGWYYALPLVLFLQGMINASRFSSMNTLTLKDLRDDLASSGNSLLSMVMQLSMSIGVTIAGLLLGLYGQQHMSLDAASTHQVFLYTYLSMAAIIALPALIFSGYRMTSAAIPSSVDATGWIVKLWRPGITGKLFLAIFATCIVLLISMHWAVRISFERGFIDYKRGNEQRLTMLSDALSEQYAQHGSWAFLRNNDRFIFQLRAFERDNDDRSPPGHAMKRTPPRTGRRRMAP